MTLLAPGTPIAVIAPSGVFDPANLEAGIQIARNQGHDLRPLPGLLRPHRYLAADDDRRRAHLIEALTSPAYGAVWVARGGYGLTRLLHHLPDDLPPRPVLGFSDVTALFCALHRRGAGPLVHGPVLHALPATDPASVRHLFELLANGTTSPLQGRTLLPGQAEGPILGGNLALLAALCGTPDALDAQGAILVLEEVGEAPYRVDRLLQQIRAAGVLDGVAGVAAGTFTGCAPPEGAEWTIHDILREHLAPLGVPVVVDLPIGHGRANHAFRWGARVRLDDGRLTFLDEIP